MTEPTFETAYRLTIVMERVDYLVEDGERSDPHFKELDHEFLAEFPEEKKIKTYWRKLSDKINDWESGGAI